MFITDSDLNTVLDEHQMMQVIGATTYVRKRAEHFAIEEAASYLNFQYDTVAIFGFEAFDYNNTESYKAGQIVVDDTATGFTCVADAPAGTLLTNDNFFEEKDGRSPIVAMIVVDILAYHLFSKISDNMIPRHIIDRYEQAIKKLKDIRIKKMNPILPLTEVETNDPNTLTQSISILSNPKRGNFYE